MNCLMNCLLFGFVVAPKDAAIVALIGLAAAFAVSWLLKKDTAIEHRRRDVIDVAGQLQQYGWDRTASLAKCYAVGDYSGLYAEMKALLRDFSHPETAADLVSQAVCKGLPEVLKHDGHREKVLKIVADFQQLNTPPPVNASTLKTAR